VQRWGEGPPGDGHPGLTALLQRAAPTLRQLNLVRVSEQSALLEASLPALRGAGFAASPLSAGTLARLSALTYLDLSGASLNGRAIPPSLRGLRELWFGAWAPEVGVARAVLAPGVTVLRCRLPSPRDLSTSRMPSSA